MLRYTNKLRYTNMLHQPTELSWNSPFSVVKVVVRVLLFVCTGFIFVRLEHETQR